MKTAKKKSTNKKKKNQKVVIKTKRKKRKLRYKRIFLALFLICLIVYLFFHLFDFRIRTITVSGNEYLNEQQVITLSGLQNYPSTLTNSVFMIKKRLEKDQMIKKATVRKKGLFNVTIKIEENRPLFYDKTKNKTILEDKTEIKNHFSTPILINYVPDKIYQKLISKMNLVKPDILKRISEIEYKPNEVDKNRFLLSMQDGNYVYLTIYKFENINNYIEIIRKFEHKKGILYLDSGEYFKVYEEN